MKKRIVALMAVLVVLGACSGTAGQDFQTISSNLGGSAAETTTTAAAATTTAPGENDFADEESGVAGVPSVSDRKVIYDVQMQLEAADTRAAFDRIIALVQGSGGFVAATSIGDTSEEDEQPTISITLRLPADNLTATLTQIRAVADKVVTESLQSQDVTDQFVDIEAQLRNLTALETELLALLAELRDNNNADPSKLLQVFDQIRATRGEIEQLEGRRQMLDNLVSLATLQIGISPLPAAAPIVPNDPAWEPAAQAKGALRDLVEALQGLGDGLIRIGLYTLPILVIAVGPLALVAWFIWKRLKPRTAQAPASV
ncbi:MAG: DUF4349 domain-containing protein [Acidimicrobiia bacterium]